MMSKPCFYAPSFEGLAYFSDTWSAEAEAFLIREQCEKVEFDGRFEDFAFLKNCGQAIKHLRVINQSNKIDGLKYLQNLETLSIECKNKDPFSFEVFKKLRDLDIKWTNKPQVLSALRHSNIKELALANLPELDEMVSNESLEKIRLERLKTKDLSAFTRFARLLSIHVSESRTLTSLDGMPTGLSALRFDYCKKLENIEALESLMNLEIFLTMRAWHQSYLPEVIYQSKTMQRLGITGSPLQIDWERILSMPSIDYAALVNDGLGPTDAELHLYAKKYGRKILEIGRQGTKKMTVTWVELLEPPGLIHSTTKVPHALL